MLSNMAYWDDKANVPPTATLDNDGQTVDDGVSERELARHQAQMCARDAAPYLHPRQQPVVVAPPARRAIHDFSDDELVALAGGDDELNDEFPPAA
jgi:hypothetical protein